MDINVAYLHNNKQDVQDENTPLLITACGFYRFKSGPIFKTHRPKGRKDYQLLYISAGKAHFKIRGENLTISQGTAILFRPGEAQSYFYLPEEKAEVYWTHCTGYDVENILERYAFPTNRNVFHIGVSQTIHQLFESLIQELQLCRVYYEDMITVLFKQILLQLQRRIQENTQNNTDSQALNDMEKAMQFFKENFNKNISVEEYAKTVNMSACWFIRRFKEFLKVTPMQYIISLRMTHAKMLLETQLYNVAQVAYHVGYDNPLYFSRLFTKFVGVPPKQYKKLFDK